MNEHEMARLVVRLVGDGESYLRMLKQVQQETARTKKETGMMLDGFKDFGVHVANRLMGGIGMGGILATGALGFAKLMETGIEARQKREEVERSMTAVLTANGRAVEETKEKYAEYATELREVTGLTKLHTTELLKSAEAYGLTGEAARNAVMDANALGAIVGGGAESMLKVTKALEEGNLKLAMSYGRLIPQLRGVKDEEEWLVKYHKLVEAGTLAEADAAEDLDHKWEIVREQLEDVSAAFGEVVLKFGEVGLEAAKMGVFGPLGMVLNVEPVEAARDALKEAAEDIHRINKAYKDGKRDMADYFETRQELVRKMDEANKELRERSAWDVTLEELLGRTAGNKYEAAIKALDAGRKKTPLTTEEQLRKAATFDLKEWIKELRDEAKVADLATEAERRRADIINKGGVRGDAGREMLAELDHLQEVIKLKKDKLALEEEGYKTVRQLQSEIETIGMTDLDKTVYKLRQAADEYRRAHPTDRAGYEAFRSQIQAAQIQADRLEAERIKHDHMTPMERLGVAVARLNHLRKKGLLTEELYAREYQKQRDAILGMMAALAPAKAAWSGDHLRQRFLDYHSPGGLRHPTPQRVERGPMPRVVGADHGDGTGWGSGSEDVVAAIDALRQDMRDGAVRFVTTEAA